jgi:methyl-accepting chemotaxis protein
MPRVSFDPKITFGNVLTMLGMALLAASIWYGLAGRVDSTGAIVGKLEPVVNDLQSVSATFNTRLTVVESRAETQALKMTEMTNALETLNGAVQSLSVTSATTKTDVGYIRDWVEQLKREAKQ